MARYWVLRKLAGLVLLSGVVCAVRMPAAAGGIRSTLFLGLLLRSQSGCVWWCCCPLVGVRVVSGVLDVGVVGGSGRWASNRFTGCVWVGSFGAWSGRLVG